MSRHALGTPLRRERGEYARPAPNALMEAREVVFLVGRVDPVVIEAEADQQRVHAEEPLEVGADRDRGARSDEQRVLAPLVAERTAGGAELRHAPVERKRRRERVIDELGTAVGRQARPHEGAERGADLLRILSADQAERDLRGGLRRNDRLRALARIAAPDAVDVAGRTR